MVIKFLTAKTRCLNEGLPHCLIAFSERSNGYTKLAEAPSRCQTPFPMNCFLLAVLLVLAGVSIADETEPEDLGTVDPDHGILLHKDTSRSDWVAFYCEFLPLDTYNTNAIPLTLTNDVVQVKDLAPLPSGRIVVSLQNVFNTGGAKDVYGGLTKGAVHVYRFELRRAEPPAPSATKITILPQRAYTNNTIVQEWIRLTQLHDTNLPPMPVTTDTQPLPSERQSEARRLPITNQARIQMTRPPALPNANNKTYAQHLDEMADFFRAHQGNRRNE